MSDEYPNSLSEENFQDVVSLCKTNAPNKGEASKLIAYLKEIEKHYPLIDELEKIDYRSLLSGTKFKSLVDNWRKTIIAHYVALKTVKIIRNSSIDNGGFFKKNPYLEKDLTKIIDVCKLIKKRDKDYKKKLMEKDSLLESAKTELEKKISETDEEMQKLDTSLEAEKAITAKQESSIKQLRDELIKKETAKLAIAFKNQKDDYISLRRIWLAITILAFILLIASVISSLLIYSGVWELFGTKYSSLEWYDRYGIFLLDLVIVSFTYFSAKQYAKSDSKYDEFANKEAIAQSFWHLFDAIAVQSDDEKLSEEKENIKNKFLDRASSVLYSETKLSLGKKTNLPMDEVVKILNLLLSK